MTQSRRPEENMVDAALSALRDAPPPASDDLIARVMADALAEMPTRDHVPIWRQVLGALGGWPALTGLAATACIGVWAGGVLSDDLLVTLGTSDSAALEISDGLGAFDLLLVDG